jgi:hypothetical protein
VGGLAGSVPPVPIPNTEVKSPRADGSYRATGSESRTPPLFSSFAPKGLRRTYERAHQK